jgi:membrane protein implicated in regulation of membrane protease activity
MSTLILADWSATAVYWYIAIGATALFVVKMLMTLVGGAFDADADFDADALDVDLDGADVDHGSTSAFAFFSVQSILAFLMGFGWMALTAEDSWQLGPVMTFVSGGVFGILLMFLNVYLMFMIRKLNARGNVDLNSCVGRTGRVYLRIPARGDGAGQVEVEVSGRRKVVRALSTGPAIDSFTEVRVVDVKDNREIIVQPEV